MKRTYITLTQVAMLSLSLVAMKCLTHRDKDDKDNTPPIIKDSVYTGELKVYGKIYTLAGSNAIGATINLYLTQDSMNKHLIFRTNTITDSLQCAYFKDIPTYSVANKPRTILIDGVFSYSGDDLSGSGITQVTTSNKGTKAVSLSIALAP